MIRVTLEFATQAELVAFFAVPTAPLVATPEGDKGPKQPKAAKPAATPQEPASTPPTAATAQTDVQTAPAEITPEMGSALIVRFLPTPEHKTAAAEILAKHDVKGFKHLDTAAARAACYADLLAKATELGLV